MEKHRKQIRLKNYDYSQSGLYFVTICTENRKRLFGDIVGVGRDRPPLIGRDRSMPDEPRVSMILNQYGTIVKNVWKSLPDHHSVELDAFQIMSNHVHFILHIVLGASRRAPTTLGTIVGLFKSECTKQINNVGATRGSPDSKTRGSPKIHIWQRNYYEHIIRNENELIIIREYIKLNPLYHV